MPPRPGATRVHALLLYCLYRETRSWKKTWLSLAVIALCCACVPYLMMVEDYYLREPSLRGVTGDMVHVLPFWALLAGFLPLLWPGLSADRRNGALLHLTTSGPRGVCLARLGVAVISSWFLLSLTLPLAMLAAHICLITWLQIAAFYVLTAIWILCVGALALLCSAILPNRIATTAVTVLVVATIFGVLIGLSVSRADPYADIGDQLLRITVIDALRLLLMGNNHVLTYLLTALLHLLTAAALAALALRTYIRNPDIETVPTVIEAPAPPAPGPAAPVPAPPALDLYRRLTWQAPPRPPAGPAAVAWKEFHYACLGTFNRWFLPLLPLAFVGFGIWNFGCSQPHLWLRVQAIISAITLIAVVALFLLNAFRDEVLALTLDDLLVLPLTPRQLINAKIRGIARAVLPLAISMLAAFALTILSGDLDFLWAIFGDHWFATVPILTALVILFWLCCLSYSIKSLTGFRP